MAWWEGVEETRLLLSSDPGEAGDKVGRLLSLRHPKTGEATSYLLTNGVFQEIHWFKQAYGSWFLGDYVCEDGRLYAATPVDPVFILLPIFDEARMKKGGGTGKFRQLDEIIFVNGYPGYQHLITVADSSMQVVCDHKEIGSTKFFRLNESKVLAWLRYKVHQVKQTLSTLDRNYAARDEKDILADAVSILAEYLKDEPWLKLLCSDLKLNLEATKAPEIELHPSDTENKFQSFDAVQEKSTREQMSKRSTRQTKKAKVETESKNIRDMFSRASRRQK